MKFNKTIRRSATALAIGLLLSCSSDNDPIDGPDEGIDPSEEQFVIAASDSENAYLLTTDNLEEGSVSPKNSLQVIGEPSWYFAGDKAVYGFIYRQGDPGTTQSFSLNEEGKLEARNEIDLAVSIQSKGLVDDKIYIEYSSRNYEEPTATFYSMDPVTQDVNGPVVLDTEELADNGEYAYITAIQGYKDKILVGFRTIKAGSDGSEETGDLFGSDFNDHTYIGIYNKNLELEKVIEDHGRTGMIAGQWRATAETGIEPVENGDVYVFSSALDAPEVPSGILKINDGDLDFDADYFFDISEASGGYKLYRTYYAGDNKFVLQMFTDKGIADASPDFTRNKFAVIDVVQQTFDWVNNVPEGILDVGEPYASKGEVVFPIETGGYPRLYTIDVSSAEMKAGLEVKAEGVTAIGKLKIQH